MRSFIENIIQRMGERGRGEGKRGRRKRKK